MTEIERVLVLIYQVLMKTGSLQPILAEHFQTGGKRLRAHLALQAAQRLGVASEQSIVWAAACEMAHNATLIHDDLQDGDMMRRGKPTVWYQYGMPQAINAGDMLLMLPYACISHMDAEYSIKNRLHACMAEQMVRVIEGQAQEGLMTSQSQANRERYDSAIMGKTGALFRLPVEGAAIMADVSDADSKAIGEWFAPLGMLFQMQDDILDLYGKKGREQIGTDIQEGKISAMVVEYAERCPEKQGWLHGILKKSRNETLLSDIEQVSDAFMQSGSLHAVFKRIEILKKSLCENVLAKQWPLLDALMQENIETIMQPIYSVVK